MFANRQDRFSKAPSIILSFINIIHKNRDLLDSQRKHKAKKQLKHALGPKGSTAKFDKLLSKNPALINNPDVLIYAIDGEDKFIIEHVIKKGVDVNQVKNGVAPLIYMSSNWWRSPLLYCYSALALWC